MPEIRILKDNLNKEKMNKAIPYPRKVICDSCGSELEYDESDLYIGEYGCVLVKCPVCGESVILDGNEHEITLNMNNIEFPNHFYHLSTDTGAVDACNTERIRGYIKDGIEFLRQHPDEFYWNISTGNLCMYVHRYEGDGEYCIVLTKDYYEVSIPFEDKDYL